MDSLQTRRSASFQRVLLLAADWPTEMANPTVQATLAELRSTHEAILELDQRKGPSRGATDRTQQITAWTQELRQQLMVLKTAAELHLKDQDGKPITLKVPPFKAKPSDVLRAAEEFDATLRPFLPILIGKGFPGDVLAQLQDAANQLKHALDAPNSIKTHKTLRGEMNEMISRGLKLIQFLRRLLSKRLSEDAVFRGHFNAAAKVGDKPGPPKEKTTATLRKARERRHRKRPLPKPRRREA